MTLIKSISGIRGTIGGKAGEGLSPVDVFKFTSAFYRLIRETRQSEKITIVIGRDARISGSMVSMNVASTLMSLGANVIDCGLSTTPSVEMAVIDLNADGGIIITASHNPMQWNALKLLNAAGEFLSSNDAAMVLKYAEEGHEAFCDVQQLGTYQLDEDSISRHIAYILNLPLVKRDAITAAGFHICIDAINSTGATAIPQLLEALGVKTINVIHGEVHGRFEHNPEPLPENLEELSQTVQKEKAHLGFAVDPDVDRLAIVDENGDMFGEEYTLVAVADYILQHKKGNTVSNLSSTSALRDITKKYKAQYFPSAVGEVNVVAMMKEKKAVIGGEGNGGVIYPELHYGRDALLGIALFLSSLALAKTSCSQLRSSYPDYYISKNKIELDPESDIDALLKQISDKYIKQPQSTIDGLRIDFEKEWVHLRRSNTEPIIRIYAEADAITTADHLAAKIMNDIREFLNPEPEE